MAAKDYIFSTLVYEPPPVTKEEALNPRQSFYETPDGYDGHGGGEIPSEFYLDRMVYPHDVGPIEQAACDRQDQRAEQSEEIMNQVRRRSCVFTPSEDSFLGESCVLSAYDQPDEPNLALPQETKETKENGKR